MDVTSTFVWALYGHTKPSYTSRSDDTLVAKFTNYEDAIQYIRDSELASPKPDRRYRIGSLLEGYDDACLEYEDELDVPINPVV